MGLMTHLQRHQRDNDLQAVLEAVVRFAYKCTLQR